MKSPDNCPVFRNALKNGVGGCQWWWHIEGGFTCQGYQVSKIDDEPCDKCKRCKHCILNEGEVEE